MNKGRNPTTGVIYENLAAMSLFLQFFIHSDFYSIELQGDDLEDFTLHFKSGKKIIGEAKDWKKPVSYTVLKGILQNILDKKQFNIGDQILIACSRVNKDLLDKIKYLEFSTEIEKKFSEQGYSEEQINLLGAVGFWVVDATFNERAVLALVSDLFNLWLPKAELEGFVKTVLVDDFIKKSKNGGTLLKEDFQKSITEYREEAMKRSAEFNVEYTDIATQYDELEKGIQKGGKPKIAAQSNITAWSGDINKVQFVRKKLEEKKINDLAVWDSVWKIDRVRFFVYGIFDIFENNLHTKSNREYVIKYCTDYVKEIRGYYRGGDYFANDIVKVFSKILDVSGRKELPSYLDTMFEVLFTLLKSTDFQTFYLRTVSDDHIDWQKEEICKLVKKLYDLGSTKLKEKILNELVWQTFDLISDEEEISRNTPLGIYEIVSDWLASDFHPRFPIFVEKMVNQYKQAYAFKEKKKRSYFTGWELIGGTTSFLGARYSISDRHFVDILGNAILEEYKKSEEKTWTFIKNECIAKEAEVSVKKPDFLNRAVYQIVLQRFASKLGEESTEARLILEDFLSHKHGIPHKTDLIFQWIARSGELSREKSWKLLKKTLDEYDLPVSPFIEELVLNVALTGNVDALKLFGDWYKNEKYYQNGRISNFTVVSNIRKFLDTSLEVTFELFQSFTGSDFFLNDASDLFQTYDVARLLTEILHRQPDKGIDFLNQLVKKGLSSKNQRALFCFGLFERREGFAFTQDTLLRVYREVLDPFLEQNARNVSKIVSMIPEDGFRSNIVKFAEECAKQDLIGEAIKIVRIFITDPSPYLPGKDPDPEEEKYNEHNKIISGEENLNITSVRGWCGWVLMRCAVLQGREYIRETVDLAEKLLHDQNYYVMHMATFAYDQIMRVRLTRIAEGTNELYLNQDKKTAVIMSKNIEREAFLFLESINKIQFDKAKMVLGKSALRVIDHMRQLNQSDAKKLLSMLQQFPLEVQSDAIPLYIFFALFRKNAYPDVHYQLEGLYDDLTPEKFDENYFENELQSLITRLQSEDPNHCFKIISTFEFLMRDKPTENDSRIEGDALKYFNLVAEKYATNAFTILYKVILEKMNRSLVGFDKWHELYVKALKTEATYYNESKAPREQMYWLPSSYNSDILELIYKTAGDKKFLEAAALLFDFPLDFELHIAEGTIEKLKKLSQSDQKAKELLRKLYAHNHGKWRHLKSFVE